MCDRLHGDYPMGAGALALIEALDFRGVAHREVRRLDERPGQILVAVLGVAPTLALAMTQVLRARTAAVGGKVPHRREAADTAGLLHEGQN
jgi:hypothetical protein